MRYRQKGPLLRLGAGLWAWWRERRIVAFYRSERWKRLRLKVLAKYGRRCMRCHTCGTQHNWICVDHIKSVRRYWWRRRWFSNLQVLCNDCNRWKGGWNETDFRPAGWLGWMKKST